VSSNSPAVTASPPPPADAAPPGLSAQLLAIGRDIKLSHTIFALPFAVLAALLAPTLTDEAIGLASLGLIVLCMVLARTAAMTANRWLDARFDAANPRTAGRAVPAGRVSLPVMRGMTLATAAAFIAAAALFWPLRDNPWPLAASPVVVAWLIGYSLTKRFTAASHLVLGAALAISPLAAGLAMAPAALAAPDLWLLAAMVLCWVAGFDILYALQDVEVDQKLGLHSIPARFGVDNALGVSRILHGLALLCLVALAMFSPVLGAVFALGVVACALLLATEHLIVARSGVRRLHLVFFTLNGVISVLLACLGTVDILLARGA